MSKKKKNNKAQVLSLVIPDFRKVTVTAADIKNGKKGSPQWCPIACAIRRQLGTIVPSELEVSDSHPSFSFDIPIIVPSKHGQLKALATVNLDLYLGSEADEFINAFDEGQPVKPMTFVSKVKQEIAVE